jgi:hypothetical protein
VEEDEMDRPCSSHGEKRNLYRIFVGKPEGRKPGRHVGGKIILK